MKYALFHRCIVVICFAAGLASCGLLNADKLPAALGGPWIVQQIAGASLGEHVEIFLEIDARTGEITGFTGCNRFSAPMTAFGDALSVGAVQERPGECANAAAATDEARFLAVLPLVRRYARRGNSLELLPQGYGEALLNLRVDNLGRLTRASVQQQASAGFPSPPNPSCAARNSAHCSPDGTNGSDSPCQRTFSRASHC